MSKKINKIFDERLPDIIKHLERKIEDDTELYNKINEQKAEIDHLTSTFDDRLEKIKAECRKEIEKKDKSLKAVSETNKKLIENLEVLNGEVDEKLDRGAVFKKAESKMKSMSSKREKPLEILVKVKEKEIHNINNLLGIMKRDKELLEKERDEKQQNPFLVSELQDKLKFEEKKVFDLTNEIKTYQKLHKNDDDKKRFEEIKLQYEKERKSLRDEIHMLKEKLQTQHSKQRDDESARNLVLHAKVTEVEVLKKKLESDLEGKIITIDGIKNKHPDAITTIEELEKQREIDLERLKEEAKAERIEANKNKNVSHKRNLSQSQEIGGKQLKHMKNKSYSTVNLNLNKSNRTSSGNKADKHTDHSIPQPKIFNDEEKHYLEKRISKEEVEKYEKRFIALEHNKNSIENKAKLDIKGYVRQIQEYQEKIDYLNILFKESEQKNKILQHQVNESKLESRTSSRKTAENNQNIEYLSKLLKEKEQENKILLHKFNAMKRLTKHNALAPLGVKTDYEKTENPLVNMNETNIEIIDTDGKKHDSNENKDDNKDKDESKNAEKNVDVDNEGKVVSSGEKDKESKDNEKENNVSPSKKDIPVVSSESKQTDSKDNKGKKITKKK